MTSTSPKLTATPDWVRPADREQHAADVSTAFQECFGTEPAGVWAAPGRVNLIGEHLDYNGGPVLPIAIGHRTMVAVAHRDDNQMRLRSRQVRSIWDGSYAALRADEMPGWCRYAAGVLWAMTESGQELPGFDVMVDGRVPSGAGLSSSAALTCAVAVAVADLVGMQMEEPQRARALATWCVRAENDFAGAPTGGMDQSVVLRAEADHGLLLDCSTFDAEQVPIPDGGDLLVVDTRTHHALTDGQYGGRRAACEAAAVELSVPSLGAITLGELPSALRRLSTDELRGVVRHVITETARVGEVVSHLRAGRLLDIGPTLSASHASMRDDFVISTPELDLVVDAAAKAGAAGARMTGGGFGGSAVVVCKPGDRGRIAAAISARFDEAGCAAPGMLAVEAVGPAGRV